MSLGLAVLISGEGSNLQALIDAIAHRELDADIRVVLSNTVTARGLNRAQQAGLPTLVVDHRSYTDRDAFDQALLTAIEPFAPDLIVLAGFMRILTSVFINRFAPYIVNIHPSLLPKYKGLHTHERALNALDSLHGCSIHGVTAKLDDGPILSQAMLEILPGDDAQSLQQRVHLLEHQLYPLTLNAIAKGELNLEDPVHVQPLYFRADAQLLLHPDARSSGFSS